jgi:predicted RNase H-like nuclease (RuvC/YqgF family)
MKDDTGELDLTKKIEELDNSLSTALDINNKYQREKVALKKEMEELRAQLARAKEDHQFDKLVHEKELESLKNPLLKLREKGLV